MFTGYVYDTKKMKTHNIHRIKLAVIIMKIIYITLFHSALTLINTLTDQGTYLILFQLPKYSENNKS